MVAIDDPRVENCAFAKLHGVANFPDPGYYLVKKYEVVLGRKSKSSSLDVVLGDNMNISRKHAKLEYNFSVGAYQLVVMGKNGVTVGGVLYTPNSPPLSLKSRDFIQIGDTSFHFLLPKESTSAPANSSKKRSKPDSSSAPTPSRKMAQKVVKTNKPSNHKKPSARGHGSGGGGESLHGRSHQFGEERFTERYYETDPYIDMDQRHGKSGMAARYSDDRIFPALDSDDDDSD